ncbi:hypothetical protein D3C81_2229510 [compost metagenome]
MPISRTAISVFSLIESTVSGKPIWLLKFPWVLWTLYWPSKRAVIISFVVVLPLLPVIATTCGAASLK